MNYDKLIEKLFKKACGKEIDKVSLKIYSNLLARGCSVEKVYEKMQSRLLESPIPTIKYFFEKYHGVELTEKEKLFFLNDYSKNGLLKCLKNIKEYKYPENKNDDQLKTNNNLHTPQKNLNILYCSLIRDKEHFLEKWLDDIKSLKNLRPSWNIYLSCYENDSVDKTKEVLKKLDYSFLSWVKITSEDTGKKLYFNKERDRVKNLAAYRNLCINQYADLDKIDRIIMHDVDCVYDPEKAVHLIEESLKWDILSGLSNPSNNDKIIYDSWVTRKDKLHKKWDYKSFIKLGINEVYSTGNGFVCYNPEPFRKGIGFGYIIDNIVDSENVVICENFRENNYNRIAFDTRCKIHHFEKKQIKNIIKAENSVLKEYCGFDLYFYEGIINNFEEKIKNTDPNKKNILFISNHTSISGAPLTLFSLMEEFIERNEYNVFLFCIVEKDSLMKDCLKLKQKFNCLLIPPKYSIGTKSEDYVIDFFKKINPDYIYSNGSSTCCYAYDFDKSKKSTAKTFFHFHENEKAFKNCFTKYMGEKVKEFLENIDRIHVVSKWQIENMLKMNVESRKIFYNTPIMDIKKIKNDFSKAIVKERKKKVIIGCGSQSMRKGIDRFIEVSKFFDKNEYSFKWVGNVKTKNGKITLPGHGIFKTKTIPIGNVDFIGEKENVVQEFLNSDIFLMLSREEACPIVSMESYFINLPSICLKESGDANIFCEKENVIEEYHPVKIKLKILEILNNKLLKNKINKEEKLTSSKNFYDEHFAKPNEFF